MRALRTSLIVCVALVGLLVAADRVAVWLAEKEAAQQIESGQRLSERPSVSIWGFPFLTQALSKEFDAIDAELTGLTAEAAGTSLRVDRVSVQLEDVRLAEGFSRATAERATGVATITYRDLTTAAPEGITVRYGGRGEAGTTRVKVTAEITMPFLNRTVRRSVLSTVSVVGDDTVRVRADDVPFAEIPGVEAAIRKRIDFDRRLSGMPAGLDLDKVTATTEGVKVIVKGRDVELTA